MTWKESFRLKGKHTSVIYWCEWESCQRWEIIWISESFERPNASLSDKIAYEVGWERIVENNIEHWLCQDCAELYRQEQLGGTMVREYSSVEAGSDNQ